MSSRTEPAPAPLPTTGRAARYRPPVELAPGLWRLRVPQPRFAANYVYLLLGRVPTLIDAGHPDPSTQLHLDRGLAELGLRRSDLAQVLYTHTHLDHLGGGIVSWGDASLLHVEHRVPVGAADAGVDVAFGAYTRRLHDWRPWLGSQPPHPLVAELLGQGEARHEGHESWLFVDGFTGRAMSPRALVPGERVEAGDLHLDIVDVHGHDPWHVAFVEPTGAWAITGDVVVTTPTPLLPPMDDDALPYREALDTLAAIAPDRVFPAHGPVFDDGAAAIARTTAEFDGFADLVHAAVTTQDPSGGRPPSAPEVLAVLIDRLPALNAARAALPGVMLGNVHSHLTRLARLGRVVAVEPHRFSTVRAIGAA